MAREIAQTQYGKMLLEQGEQAFLGAEIEASEVLSTLRAIGVAHRNAILRLADEIDSLR